MTSPTTSTVLPEKPESSTLTAEALRVLFLDDERSVLDGLRRAIPPQRDWTFHFVETTKAAIDALESAPFDVIVTDMRMPGMNGAEFLKIVKARWPRTARLVLSGYASELETLYSFDVAHRFLNKPCSAETMVSAIELVWGVVEHLDS